MFCSIFSGLYQTKMAVFSQEGSGVLQMVQPQPIPLFGNLFKSSTICQTFLT